MEPIGQKKKRAPKNHLPPGAGGRHQDHGDVQEPARENSPMHGECLLTAYAPEGVVGVGKVTHLVTLDVLNASLN